MASRHSPTEFRQLPHSSSVPSGAGNRFGSIGPVQMPCGPKVAWTRGQPESSQSGLNQCSLRPAWPRGSQPCGETPERSTPMLVVVAGSAKSPQRLSSAAQCLPSMCQARPCAFRGLGGGRGTGPYVPDCVRPPALQATRAERQGYPQTGRQPRSAINRRASRARFRPLEGSHSSGASWIPRTRTVISRA